jgi:hypothetical protein
MNRGSGTLLMMTALVAGGCGTSAPVDEDAAGLENGSFTAQLNGFEIHY